MTRGDVDLIGLDLAVEQWVGLRALDALAQLLGHALHIIFVEPQLAGDLAIRQIQADEVQAQHPGAQRLMMTRKDRARQVVEPTPAVAAAVLLTLRLGGIPSLPGDRCRTALHAAHLLWPAQRAHRLDALGIVDERLDVQHQDTPAAVQKGRSVSLDRLLSQHQPAALAHQLAAGHLTGTHNERN
jgi:hypothetical protein